MLRRYENYQDSFLRVSFSDEDNSKFRFEKEVDMERFVRELVGDTLKVFQIPFQRVTLTAYHNGHHIEAINRCWPNF